MAVNVNTVYQRVLTIANKEQRGYITPQEFNILANQAQMDLFEQYFYDINQFNRVPGNSTEYSDMLSLLEEKIAAFKVNDSTLSDQTTLPSDLYRLGEVYYKAAGATYPTPVARVNANEATLYNLSPLARPTTSNPAYVRETDTTIQVYPDSIGATVSCNYIKTPTDVVWGYNTISSTNPTSGVTTSTSLYNASTSTNFDLHESEEVNLVNRILVLAGITIKDVNLASQAAQEEVKDIQQEKS
jgi:hypothetical protein